MKQNLALYDTGAVPEDPVLIEKLLQAVQQKDTIAAAYGRQLPDDKVG